MRKQGWLWQCELVECGHEWIARGIDAPEQCAKCKKRGWHTKGVSEAPRAMISASEPLDAPMPKKSIKNLDALRDICNRPQLERKNPTPSEIYAAVVEEMVAISWCSRTGYDETDGETYACGLRAGHRGQCTKGIRL